MANPARAYLATQVETTSQGELLIMLYEAAIKFLKRAKIEIEVKDYAKKGIYISKAMAIIHELSESLNKEKGGDITPTLLSLYQFCTSQLVKANIRMDTKRVDEVIKILDGIRSAYAQIVPQEDAKSSPTTISAQAQSAQAAQIKAAQAQAAQTQSETAAALQAETAEVENAPESPAPPPVSKPQTKYGRPMGQRGYGGLGGRPFAPAQPQAAPVAPAPAPPVPEPSAPVPPTPAQQAQPAAPVQQATPQPAQPAPPPPPAPEPAQPTPAPKLRNAFNAAKFRAANAYTNNS